MQRFKDFAKETGLSHIVEGRDDWLVPKATRHRGSSPSENASFLRTLKHFGGESATVEVHRFRHWLVGWIEKILISPRHRPQAKNVPEDVILEIMRKEPGKWFTHYDWRHDACLPFHAPELRRFPEKVLRAKLSKMMKRGLINGCDCGCRGDWHINDGEQNGAGNVGDPA